VPNSLQARFGGKSTFFTLVISSDLGKKSTGEALMFSIEGLGAIIRLGTAYWTRLVTALADQTQGPPIA
jgi:hypothetical protein